MKYNQIGDSITAERAGITVYGQDIKPLLDVAFPGVFGPYTTGYDVPGAGVVNHGHGGYATQSYGNPSYPGFKDTWTVEALNEDADIVSIMLGTNDSFVDGWPGNTISRVSLADYQTNLESFVDQLRADTPSVTIILMSPPPVVTQTYGGTGYGSNATTELYRDVVATVAAAKATEFIDVYTLLWDLSGNSEATFNTTYTLDGMHLNQAGQDLLTTWVYAEIEALIPVSYSGTMVLSDGTINHNIPYYDDYVLGTTGGIVLSDGVDHYRVGLVDSGGIVVANNGVITKQLETV